MKPTKRPRDFYQRDFYQRDSREVAPELLNKVLATADGRSATACPAAGRHD